MSGNVLSFIIEIESKLEGAKLAKAEIEKQITAAKAAGTEYKHLESALRMVDSQIANLTKTMAADRAATAGLSKETADYVRNLREMGDQSEEAAGAHRGLHHEISALAGVIPGVAELAAFSISEVAGLAAVLGYVFSKEKEGIENLKATMASAYKQLDLSNIWRSNREQLQDLNLSEERHAELLARIAAQQDTVTEAMQRNLRVAAAQSAANQESDDARTKLEKATIEREQKFNPNEREKQLMEADNRAEERRVKRDHDARHMQEMVHQNAAQGEESSAKDWGEKAAQARAELAALTKSGGSQETIGQFAAAHLQDLGNINELLASKVQRRAELKNKPWLLRSTAEQVELGTLNDEQIPDLQRRKTRAEKTVAQDEATRQGKLDPLQAAQGRLDYYSEQQTSATERASQLRRGLGEEREINTAKDYGDQQRLESDKAAREQDRQKKLEAPYHRQFNAIEKMGGVFRGGGVSMISAAKNDPTTTVAQNTAKMVSLLVSIDKKLGPEKGGAEPVMDQLANGHAS